MPEPSDLLSMLELAANTNAAMAEVRAIVDDRTQALHAGATKLRQLTEQIKAKIQRGESTGDLALDFQLLFEGKADTDSATYLRLSDFIKDVTTSPGQLILIESERVLGIIPPEKAIVLPQEMHEFALGEPAQQVIRLRLNRAGDSGPMPSIGYHVFRSTLAISMNGMGYGCLIGDEMVTTLLKFLQPQQAFAIWQSARRLGHTLELSPVQRSLLRSSREGQLAKVIDLLGHSKKARAELQRFQGDPALAFEGRFMVTRTITKTGVILDFPSLTRNIEQADTELRHALTEGLRYYGLEDNALFCEAAQLINFPLPCG